VLPASLLKELNDHLLSAFSCIDQPEIAIECHPGYLDENEWQSLTDAGFNRFSLGIQDFDEKVLKAVNRRPSLLPVENIIQILRQKNAGINMDLLYGLPLQSEQSFAKTVAHGIGKQIGFLLLYYSAIDWHFGNDATVYGGFGL
jgi:oxygen-independent coproporphyrinogen-3 oxidase